MIGKFLSRIRILPLLAVIAAVSFGMRFGDFVKQVTSAAPAQAEEKILDQMPSESMMPQGGALTSADGVSDGEAPEAEETKSWRDSLDTDFEYSDVQMELFDDLSQRRSDLDKRDREMSVREALLKAAQQEMEQKFKELSSLRSEIEELLIEQSDEEKERIASLVKIYEGMKAKDAARIFNTLDLDVLIQVVTRMSERKSAPIIAAMSADRARTVTVMLSEQKQLPQITEDFFN
jgi:flagellar motility protein MotE (MotC chaperone)